jgi:hypothetical protein
VPIAVQVHLGGQISLSASRLSGPTASDSLIVASFYMRDRQPLTTTPIRIATSGTPCADVFAHGQSL